MPLLNRIGGGAFLIQENIESCKTQTKPILRLMDTDMGKMRMYEAEKEIVSKEEVLRVMDTMGKECKTEGLRLVTNLIDWDKPEAIIAFMVLDQGHTASDGYIYFGRNDGCVDGIVDLRIVLTWKTDVGKENGIHVESCNGFDGFAKQCVKAIVDELEKGYETRRRNLIYTSPLEEEEIEETVENCGWKVVDSRIVDLKSSRRYGGEEANLEVTIVRDSRNSTDVDSVIEDLCSEAGLYYDDDGEIRLASSNEDEAKIIIELVVT